MFDNPFGPFGQEYPGEQNPTGGAIPEAQRVLQGLLAELPDNVRALTEKIERDIAKIEEQIANQAQELRQRAESQIAELEGRADNRRKTLYQHAIEQLEPLQRELLRSGDLGKSLAVFMQIQVFKARALNVLSDPGNLMRFEEIGKSFNFRVTGSDQGAVWGTDVYTSDSRLAVAAVHAGALELGEEGVVRVSMVDMNGMRIRGSARNGVMTMDWGPYRVGFRVTRV